MKFKSSVCMFKLKQLIDWNDKPQSTETCVEFYNIEKLHGFTSKFHNIINIKNLIQVICFSHVLIRITFKGGWFPCKTWESWLLLIFSDTCLIQDKYWPTHWKQLLDPQGYQNTTTWPLTDTELEQDQSPVSPSSTVDIQVHIVVSKEWILQSEFASL